ncbi:hypothetical protein CcaverHIS002_0309820 [Cutaneotrichosporon cavernicola]|nr:hypothetical protein CcaverHIS002_0309820 [Cutaneotrichosporon cavernicola]BEI98675.1 hypothetical protein CcaverHIS631_0309740 [Cutaneotrichosporon cavernicola]BEJ06445.1 hypothetical protein CcaverHIS641_0309670 [Cutaneotrichosporon cavernicola]
MVAERSNPSTSSESNTTDTPPSTSPPSRSLSTLASSRGPTRCSIDELLRGQEVGSMRTSIDGTLDHLVLHAHTGVGYLVCDRRAPEDEIELVLPNPEQRRGLQHPTSSERSTAPAPRLASGVLQIPATLALPRQLVQNLARHLQPRTLLVPASLAVEYINAFRPHTAVVTASAGVNQLRIPRIHTVELHAPLAVRSQCGRQPAQVFELVIDAVDVSACLAQDGDCATCVSHAPHYGRATADEEPCPQIRLWAYIESLIPQLRAGLIVVVGLERWGHVDCAERNWVDMRARYRDKWDVPSVIVRTADEHRRYREDQTWWESMGLAC